MSLADKMAVAISVGIMSSAVYVTGNAIYQRFFTNMGRIRTSFSELIKYTGKDKANISFVRYGHEYRVQYYRGDFNEWLRVNIPFREDTLCIHDNLDDLGELIRMPCINKVEINGKDFYFSGLEEEVKGKVKGEYIKSINYALEVLPGHVQKLKEQRERKEIEDRKKYEEKYEIANQKLKKIFETF